MAFFDCAGDFVGDACFGDDVGEFSGFVLNDDEISVGRGGSPDCECVVGSELNFEDAERLHGTMH